MNIEALRAGVLEYARWLKQQRSRAEQAAPTKPFLTAPILAALPSLDPDFESRKLVFELRSSIEATFSSQLDALLKPAVDSDDPEY